MLKIENTEVLGWGHAIRGMRNPMNSWEKSDSKISTCECEQWPHSIKKSFDEVGPNDLDLMTRLLWMKSVSTCPQGVTSLSKAFGFGIFPGSSR